MLIELSFPTQVLQVVSAEPGIFSWITGGSGGKKKEGCGEKECEPKYHKCDSYGCGKDYGNEEGYGSACGPKGCGKEESEEESGSGCGIFGCSQQKPEEKGCQGSDCKKEQGSGNNVAVSSNENTNTNNIDVGKK